MLLVRVLTMIRLAGAGPKNDVKAVPVCIISTMQHARPKVMGQMEPRRAQFIRSSTFEITNSAAFDTPAGGEADGGGGGAYGAGVGVDVDALRDGSVVWRETTL